MKDRILVCYTKCSTCKKARAFLEERGIDYVYRDVKTERPTAEELKAWIERSGLPVRKFFNTSGMLYRELGVKEKLQTMSDEEAVTLLASEGMLVKRPLLITECGIYLGFKEAEWSTLGK